jgi:tetratricopeptide (TPR) repeat protein
MSFARIAVWCLICLYLWPQASWCEDRSPQTQSRAKLHQVFSDDFSKDSLSDYQTKGEPAWETGLLRLPEGSSVSRPVELGSRVVVTAELQFPVLTKDGEQSRTMLRIELDRHTPCYAAWKQTRNDGKTSSRLFVLGTVVQDGKETLQMVNSRAVDGPVESAEWSVDYDHGLLRISRDRETVLTGFIQYGSATVGSVDWLANQSEVILRRLVIHGSNRSAALTGAELTESQQKLLADAVKKKTQLSQLYQQGKFAEAIELGESILEINRKVLGVEHPDYASSLNNLAFLHYSKGEYAKAEPLFLEARDIKKRVLGVEHPSYATSLNNLAGLYDAQGEYGKTELLYLEARDIWKRVLGVEHPDYVTSIHNLAALYTSQGHYAKAEPLYLEALDIRKRVLGEQHPHYADSLDHLASLYKLKAEYTKAEPLLLDARDIFKSALGVDHPVRQTATAKNGDTVVAIVDDNEATLKRFEKRKDKVMLKPANADMTEMIFPASSVEIRGVIRTSVR